MQMTTVGSPLFGLALPIGDVVELEHPVLLGLEVGVAALLAGLDHLKGDALLAEEHAEALVADVVDHPLGDEELGQLGQAPGREGQTVVDRARQGDLLDLAALGQGEGGRPAPGVAGHEGVEAVLVEVVQHAPTRSGEVKATLAIWATSMPWADSSTIWARRQVTTDPDERRTMRSSRLPSSLVISRTCTPSRTCTSLAQSQDKSARRRCSGGGRALQRCRSRH